MTNNRRFRLKILTWNITQRQKSRLKKITDGVDQISADIVGLQEVDSYLLESFEPKFKALGYRVLSYEFDEKPYCNLILSQYPASKANSWKRDCAFPDLLSRAQIKTPQGNVDFFNCHIPHGSGHGFEKIRTIDALLKRLGATKGKVRIVVGDFNEPRSESDSEIESWAYKTGASPSPSASERRHWDETVHTLFGGEQRHGMRDLFRAFHGHGVEGFSYKRPTPSRYDHIFGSGHFKVFSCKYLHPLREKKGHHSPLVTELGF